MYRADTGMNHVGFWARVVEYLLDYIAIWLVSSIVGMGLLGRMTHAFSHLTAAASPTPDLTVITSTMSSLGYIQFVAAVLDFIVLQAIRGQTLGKMIMGHRLVREDGSKPGWGVVIGRYFAMMLSSLILCIGFMMVGWTRHKQGLHDIICGTYVIR